MAELMDRQYIEDQHIVARYLADQLSDADREAFEAYCRDHPEIYAEMEATARFKVGLARLDEAGELAAQLAVKPGALGFVFRHAAAIGALAVGLAVLAGGMYALRTPVMGATVAEVSGRFGKPLPVAAEYELMRMRESGRIDQRVTLPAEEAALQFRVLPDMEGAVSYRAELKLVTPAGEKSIAFAEGLHSDPNAFVSFFVSSSRLAAGTYSLSVTPEPPIAQPSPTTFHIEFVRP